MMKHNNYKNRNLSQILETFPHYQQVSFAFYCSKEVESLANDQRVIDCNLAVEQWLKGDKTVDLELTRTNARNVYSDNTVNAVSAYTAAARAAASASAAAAFHAYSYAASAAYYSARAKYYNLCPNNNEQRYIAYKQFYNEYIQLAQNWLSYWHIPNFPKDEPDFPLFDFLQDYNLISYLLPKKDNFYYLNLNGFDLKHVNETELLKEIDTMHIKNIIRRIINNAES